jgi:hypothetical protein
LPFAAPLKAAASAEKAFNQRARGGRKIENDSHIARTQHPHKKTCQFLLCGAGARISRRRDFKSS